MSVCVYIYMFIFITYIHVYIYIFQRIPNTTSNSVLLCNMYVYIYIYMYICYQRPYVHTTPATSATLLGSILDAANQVAQSLCHGRHLADPKFRTSPLVCWGHVWGLRAHLRISTSHMLQAGGFTHIHIYIYMCMHACIWIIKILTIPVSA